MYAINTRFYFICYSLHLGFYSCARFYFEMMYCCSMSSSAIPVDLRVYLSDEADGGIPICKVNGGMWNDCKAHVSQGIVCVVSVNMPS